ncbi:MAG: LamG-like jellyroll fold domain-containing protein, partial [Xenococcus sp. (in: cyanobacteria)]
MLITEIKDPSLDLQSFQKKEKNNIDVLKFNFLNGEVDKLDWEGLESKKEKILDLLKKYQRLLRINPNPEIAKRLLNTSLSPQTEQAQATNIESVSARSPQTAISAESSITEGQNLAASEIQSDSPGASQQSSLPAIDSAHAIAFMTEEQFVKMLPGDEATARQMHKKAVDIKAKTQLLWANMKDAVASPHFRSMRVSTTQESDNVTLSQDIPSYQEMFGDLDYIDCEHCGSIFSPAAYFVDLMRIVDQYITEPNKDTIPEGMTLGDRRPDLAGRGNPGDQDYVKGIELTCENTNTLIPSLQIINGILEKRVGLQSLSTAKYPFNLPFNSPLEQIRTYLGHLNINLATIYETFDFNELAIAREYIGLSLEEYNLITKSETIPEILSQLYGLYNSEDLVSLTNVETFLKQTGLSRTELSELLEQNLHKSELDAGLAHDFYINQVLEGDQAVHIKTDEGNTEGISIESLIPGLVGYWPMNEGSGTIISDRAGNYNGTLQGNPQWRTVNDFPGTDSRKVLDFDGEDDYVRIEDSSNFKGVTDTITIKTWIKVNSFTKPYQAIVTKGHDSWRLIRNNKTNQVLFFITSIGGVTSRIDINDGKWHHIEAVYNGTKLKLYVDGILNIEKNASGTVPNNEYEVLIGGNDRHRERCFHGQIAEVSIWNRSLGASALDRINRFLRLAKKLNWSFTELDWVLTSIQANEIDNDAIIKIAKIKQLQAKYQLPLDVLCSFWHDMKTIGIGSNPEKPQSLFDRVFNNPFKEILGDKFIPLQDEIKQIELNNLNREAETNPSLGRILAALRLNINQLIDILRAIWGQENTVDLTVENLSQLFRTSQILRLLGLNIEEYQLLLSLLDIESISSLSIDQFIQITELAEWVK